MDEIKGYFKAVKEIALDTWNGVLNADEEEVKCICVSLMSFSIIGLFITNYMALTISSTIVGLAYAKHAKTK